MKKAMCITYEVGDSLYLNITNRCSNRCDFCIRNNGEGAYGSDSLWLEHEPTAEELSSATFARKLDKYREIVFCGYGEPTYRLPEARELALKIKEIYPEARIRINTNGQSDLILKKKTAPDFEGAFDIVSISLNTPSRERYQQICHSIFGEESFDAILAFTGEVKHFVPTVCLSAVKETLNPEEIEACKEICEKLGVTLRLRDYIPPES